MDHRSEGSIPSSDVETHHERFATTLTLTSKPHNHNCRQEFIINCCKEVSERLATSTCPSFCGFHISTRSIWSTNGVDVIGFGCLGSNCRHSTMALGFYSLIIFFFSASPCETLVSFTQGLCVLCRSADPLGGRKRSGTVTFQPECGDNSNGRAVFWSGFCAGYYRCEYHPWRRSHGELSTR